MLISKSEDAAFLQHHEMRFASVPVKIRRGESWQRLSDLLDAATPCRGGVHASRDECAGAAGHPDYAWRMARFFWLACLVVVAAAVAPGCGTRSGLEGGTAGNGAAGVGAGGASGVAGVGAAGTDAVTAGSGGSGNSAVAGAGMGGVDAGVDASLDATDAVEVSGPVPGAFMLTSPLSKPDEQSTPVLTWSASENAATFDVELSTSETFSAATTQRMSGLTTTSTLLPQAIPPAVVHFWRVTAVGPGGARTVAANAPGWFSTPFAGNPHPHAVALSARGKLLVVQIDTPSGLTILDLGTSISRMVPTGGVEARGLAVTADGLRAYVSEIGGSDAHYRVSQIDVEADTPPQILPDTVGKLIYGIAVTPDGNTLVAPAFDEVLMDDVLSQIALAPAGTTTTRSTQLGAHQIPYMVALTPDGATALVNILGLMRFDLASGNFTTIPMSGCDSVAVAGDGRTAWVTQFTDGVHEVDLTTNTPGRVIPFSAADEQCGLAVSPDGKHAVVTANSQIGVLDLVAGKVETTYPLRSACATISPDSKRAWVSTYSAEATGVGAVYALKL